MAPELALATIKKNKTVLTGLASQVNELHSQVVAAMRTGVKTAFLAGKVLSEIKDNLPHGYFEKWVEENTDVSLTTARIYKRLYENQDEIIEKFGSEAYLQPINGCVKLIAATRPLKEGKSTVAADLKPTLLEPVDGTDECPHGGSHIYDQEACINCHDPRPDTIEGEEVSADVPGAAAQPDDEGSEGGFGYQGPHAALQGPEDVAHRELCRLFSAADTAFGVLIRTLDQLNTASAMKRLADMQSSMECLYGDFRLERKEKRAWRSK